MSSVYKRIENERNDEINRITCENILLKMTYCAHKKIFLLNRYFHIKITKVRHESRGKFYVCISFY